MNNFKKGFTLIELLVVVLIIGILAAVALPQYTRAVEKSRYAEADELLQNLYSAQQRYYLIHNRYSENFGKLDIEFPNINGENETGQVLTTKNFEFLLADVNGTDHLAKAKRIKGTNSYKYGMYKDMNTGVLMCEDFDTTDKMTCNDLGLNKSVYTCSNGKISTTGSTGCSSGGSGSSGGGFPFLPGSNGGLTNHTAVCCEDGQTPEANGCDYC